MTRFRFSLRTMLIVIFILAIPLGWTAMRLKAGRDKRRAIAELTATGVAIVMDGYQDASPLLSPRLRELFGWQSVGIALGVDSDDALAKLSGMHHLRTLHIGGEVSDSGLRHLPSIDSIEQLRIGSPNITDQGLRYIADQTKMRELNLEGTQTTATGLSHLTQLRTLETLTINATRLSHADVVRLFLAQGRDPLDALVATGQLAQRPDENRPFELWLEGKQITDDLIEHLIPLPLLNSIALKSTAVTDAGLKQFRAMPQLKTLRLLGDNVSLQLPARLHIEHLDLSGDTTISAKQVSTHLRSLPNLKSLSLSYRPIVDEDLAILGQASSLQALFLGATKIEGDGLRHLGGLIELRHLHLGGSSISDHGLVHLSQLPSLRKLGLSYTSISNAGATHLKELKTLRQLNLIHTNVTLSTLQELKQALPNCKIIANP